MKKFLPWRRRSQHAETSQEIVASAATVTTPGVDGTLANPLAHLDDYELSHLVTHLAAAEHGSELRRLLFLRTASSGNAWFAAVPNVRAYLSDLTQAQELAGRQGDCPAAVAYRLIANSVRAMASVPASLLETLVTRGLLPVDEALAMAQSARAPGERITASAALLSQLDQPRQLDLADRLIDDMRTPSVNFTFVGKGLGEAELPLMPRQHIEVIRRLTAIPHLPEALLDKIAGVAPLTPSSYVRVEALCEVAGLLAEDQRDAMLAQAWALAGNQHDFRGRPEGQALVAAASVQLAGRSGRQGRDYAAEALETTLRVFTDWQERICFHDWVPYLLDITFGRSPLMRLESFAQPLRTLGPCLTDDQVTEVIRELMAPGDAQSQVAIITFLPEVAARGRATEAFQIASALLGGRLWAWATLLAAGGTPSQEMPANILGDVEKISDPEQRTLALIALMPALEPSTRYHVLRGLLASVEDLSPGSTFRRDVIGQLPPLIRRLPRDLRNHLIAQAADPGKLTRTAEEADALLSPATGLWPESLLRSRLAESRSVSLDSDITTRLRRPTDEKAVGPGQPGPAGALTLPASVAATVLDHAHGLADADKAAAVLFLAPFLERDASDAAMDVVASIGAAHLRLLPTVELLARRGAPSADSLVAVVQLLEKVGGNLRRLQSSIDTIAALARSCADSQIAISCCRLIGARDNEDTAAVLPLAAAAAGTDLGPVVEEIISALVHWFGQESPPKDVQKDQAPEVPILRLDTGAAAVALVQRLCLEQDWTAVGHMLPAMHATPGLEEASVRQAEECVLDAPKPQRRNGNSERRSLVEQIVHEAPTKARRLTALAWLLADAADRADEDGIATWSAHHELNLDPQLTGDPVMATAAATTVKALSAAGQVCRAAETMTILTRHAPATATTSRIIADAASCLQAALDSDDTQPEGKDDGEHAMSLFLAFVSSQPANYMLQESAGALLRGRVATALAAGHTVRPDWLVQLEELADADDPGEFLLEGLAVGALCDAALSAMKGGDGPGAVRHLEAAFRRWQRHRVVGETAGDLVATSSTVLAGLRRSVDPQDANETARLGAIVAAEAGIEVPTALAEQLRGHLPATAPRQERHYPAKAGKPAQPPSFGRFGTTPDEILRTEFYSYFHLDETSRLEAESGGIVIRFQNKYQYRDLCGLECTVDTAGNIYRLATDIAARFIEQADTVMIARDFARSYIADATATDEDLQVLRPIIMDLRQRPTPGTARLSRSTAGGLEKTMESMLKAIDLGLDVTVNMGGQDKDADLPEIPSRGFAVYHGERDAFTAVLSERTFSMRNEAEGNDRRLIIMFQRRSG